MSDYRYVLFTPGKQPTTEEVAEFSTFAAALANRYAFGTHRRDGALAILFESERFDRLLATDARFGSLLEKWIARGGEVVDKLPFVKDAGALKPRPATLADMVHPTPSDSVAHNKRLMAAKELAAKEAAGLSRLGVDRAIQQFARWQRIATVGPYVLLGLGALGTIIAGVQVGRRMLAANVERRSETIERVVDDPMDQSLDRRAKKKALASAATNDEGDDARDAEHP